MDLLKRIKIFITLLNGKHKHSSCTKQIIILIIHNNITDFSHNMYIKNLFVNFRISKSSLERGIPIYTYIFYERIPSFSLKFSLL